MSRSPFFRSSPAAPAGKARGRASGPAPHAQSARALAGHGAGRTSRGGAALSLAALQEACDALPVAVPAAAVPSLLCYLELLMRWNKVMNLVGARHWRECLDTLLVDSFFLASFLRSLPLPPQPQSWDLGAGAGLPGIPLRMIWQEGQYTMVEAREKRALFLATVLASLPLPGCTVFGGRVEDFFAKAPCAPHVVLSRAFMPWAEVLTLLQPVLQPGALVVFLALEPPPAVLSWPWSVAGQICYTVGQNQRWFWALRREASAEVGGA